MSRLRRLTATALVSVFALVGLTAGTGAARDGSHPLDPPTVRAINAIVRSAQGSSQSPGIVVGIWDPERGSYLRAFGTDDLATHSPMQTTDKVRIASVSKTFTGMAVLRLVDRGRLSLSDHLSKFVPDIPNGDTITVAELLNMTAGVFSYTEDEQFITDYFANPTLPFGSDDVLRIVRAHQPDFAPGTEVHYSDSNYVLLELIVEKVTGRSLGRQIQRDLLAPNGLDSTSYPTTTAMPTPYSHGYLVQPLGAPRDVTVQNPGVAGGAGAMISDVADLKAWAKLLGKGHLLSRSLRHQQRMFRTLVPGVVHIEYGLGISRLNGFLGHNGGILGYSTAMYYLPSRHATIVVAVNQDNVGSITATALFVSLASYLYPEQFPGLD